MCFQNTGIDPKSQWINFKREILFFFLIFIYLAVLDLCRLLFVACGIQLHDLGSDSGPLHRECRVSATGPPGKSREIFLMVELLISIE